MASGAGHFDSLGNPCLKFHLCGVAHEEPGLEYDGIIETGFTGFIQLPLQHAFSLKLPLEGTASYTLADGTQTACLIALAKTTFGGKTVNGAGMIMVKNVVFLLDEDELEKIGTTRQQPHPLS